MSPSVAKSGRGHAARDEAATLRYTPRRIFLGAWRRITNRFMPLAARNERLSSIYYALLSDEFGREHRGVIVGRRRYAGYARRLGEHHYLLRRNVHRLEKGLSMRPRRDVFAVRYIEETVRVHAAVAELSTTRPELVDEHELRWATDVLALYFSVTASHPVIDASRAIFERGMSLLAPSTDSRPARAPYARDLASGPSVAPDALHRLAWRRRSVRWYLPSPVPRDIVDRALEVASLSPTACNRQPFEFRIFDEQPLVAQVARLAAGTAGYGHQLPAVAVIVGKLSAFFHERDRHLIYIDSSLAAMSFILALEASGLASCCINWSDRADSERKMARLLALGPDERVVMLIGFGYADPEGLVPYSQKKPLELLRRYNV